MHHSYVILLCDFKTGKREPAAFLFDVSMDKADRARRQLESELLPALRKSVAYVVKPTTRAQFEAWCAENGLKRCGKCGQYRKLDQFSVDKARKTGQSYVCKACDNAQARSWKARNPEKVAEDRRRSTEYYSRAFVLSGLSKRAFWKLPRAERLAWLQKAREVA